MQQTTETELTFDVNDVVSKILAAIEKEREREIIARRFGLKDRRQTLEEIGQLLGITRERVRQIEKQVVTRLSTLELPQLSQVNELLVTQLAELGNVAPLSELAAAVSQTPQQHYPHINFLATLAADIEVVPENDHFHHTAALKRHHDAKELHNLLRSLETVIKEMGQPATLEEIHQRVDAGLDATHLHGLMRSSKNIASLDGRWGLTSWPLVNPKSIRDKIYVILSKQGKPMHFSDIASAIKTSRFKRRDVTTQAIHNELIKDDRFVLVGRGIYGLAEWGYKQGTVADIITDVLKQESPLHRDEIVKRVLQQRHVKPTTIILNLQGKKEFKRVAKATYALAD